ncbi:MAG: carbohydrate-binding protein, partial [Anaeromassilibacillus sp.]
MRRKWISVLLAASMALSPSYLFPGAAMALTEQDDSGYSTYECEDGEVLGNAVVSTSFSGYTGDGSVVCGMVPVQGVTLSNVTVPEEGDYTVLIRYGQSNWSARTMYVYANGNEADAQQVVFPKLKSWGLWDQIPVTVHLNAGENTLTVASGAGDSGDVVLDNVAVSDAPMVMTQVPVPNGGFESGDTTNWTVDNLSNVGYGVDEPDAFGGDYKFYFYTTSNFEGRLHQTVTGLPEGTYQVNATVKMSNGRQQASRMELSGYDGDAATQVEIPYNGGYERYSSQVEVKDGQLTIAFYCLGNAHTSMQIDNVELWKIDSTAPSETYAVQVADGQEATLSAPAEAALGETVTVSVSGLPAGKTVQAVKAVDADGTALQVVEVARDKTYSFVMPAKAVTLSVELTDISDVAKAIVSRDTVTRIEAEDYDEQAGVNVESCSDIGGGQNVGSIDAGDYMLYHNIYVEDAGTYQFRLRVASNNTDGGVEGSPDGVTIVTTAAPEGVVGTVPFTGAWQTYTDVYLDVPLDAGFQTIRFNATHEGWNINYFDIQMGAKAVVTPEGVTKIEAEDFDGQGGDPAMGDKAGIKTEPCGEDSTENIGSTDAGDYFYYD